MPAPQVKTEEDHVDDQHEAVEEAEDAADHQPERPDAESESDEPQPDIGASESADESFEVEEEMADPIENDLGGDFFSGEETVDSGFEDEAASDVDMGGFDDFGPEGEAEEEDEEPEAQFEDAINGGAARLAVIGLEDEEKEDLQDEFREVFEEFQLGHFGDQTIKKYSGSDDVDPIWGLAGSMVLCSVIVVSMRPDGDDLLRSAKQNLSNTDGAT